MIFPECIFEGVTAIYPDGTRKELEVVRLEVDETFGLVYVLDEVKPKPEDNDQAK